MNYDLAMIYESMLITEMDDKVINYLQQHTDKLPFDFLFGDDLRIVIPISDVDMTAKEIMDDIKRIKDFDKVDLKKGEVIRKIKLDPKYGQGDSKEQRVNIGRVISALKVSEEKKKKYLDWVARYKDNLESALGGNAEYSIVLSRSPVDVVRMSDHRNITSCHRSGGEYFHCAIQEAITGGAVAYLVYTEDLEPFLDELQDREFFYDSDRNAGYRELRPIARLRIRRLESDKELAIPDVQIYGNNTVPGFYKALAEFLKEKQPDIVEDLENGDFSHRGGSYMDDDMSSLITQFTGNNERYGVEHDDDDRDNEKSHTSLGWDQELDDITETTNSRLEYCSVSYDTDDNDGDPYILPSAYCKIDLTSFNLPEDAEFSAEEGAYELRKMLRDGDDGESYKWSKLIEFLNDNNDIGIGWLKFMPSSLTFHFENEESYTLHSVDEYDRFCDNVRDFDNKVENLLEDEDDGFPDVFYQMGLYGGETSDNEDYSRYNELINDLEDDDSTNLTYKNIEISGSNPRNMTAEIECHVNLKRNDDGSDSPTLFFRSFEREIENNINKLLNKNFKLKPKRGDSGQLEFQKFYESYENSQDFLNNLTIKVERVQLVHNTAYISFGSFDLRFSEWSNETFEILDFLDNNIQTLKLMVEYAILAYMDLQMGGNQLYFYTNEQRYNSLKKLFG